MPCIVIGRFADTLMEFMPVHERNERFGSFLLVECRVRNIYADMRRPLCDDETIGLEAAMLIPRKFTEPFYARIVFSSFIYVHYDLPPMANCSYSDVMN